MSSRANKNPSAGIRQRDGLFFSFGQVEHDKSNGHTKKIQDNIVHIEASPQGKQLRRFHQQDRTQTGNKEQEEVPLLGTQLRQPQTGRNEQQHIPQKIYNAVLQYTVVAPVDDHIQVVADGEKGLQIQVLP